jgi:hypothetical protein
MPEQVHQLLHQKVQKTFSMNNMILP